MITETTPLTLNQLLQESGIDLRTVLVFRHRPWEPTLNQVFNRIVSQRRDLLDCYQSTHAANTEGALKRAKFVASFIRHRPKQALFVGLYSIESQRLLTVFEYQNRPLHVELMSMGMGGIRQATDASQWLNLT